MNKTAVLYSNTAPSAQQEQKFLEFLTGRYEGEISLVWKQMDLPEGGFRLQIGSEVFDWSAAGRLSQLKEALRQALYPEVWEETAQ